MSRLSLIAATMAVCLSAEIIELTPTEAYEKQKAGAVVIDVRTPEEYYYIGHAPGHINIPFYFLQLELLPVEKRIQLADVEKKFSRPMTPTSTYKQQQIPNAELAVETLKAVKGNKEQEVILICKGGERSKAAGKILEEAGFKKVYSVKGGFEGPSNRKEFNKHNIGGWKNSEGLPWGL
ncbi:MAG: hypothetical protein K6347_07605 [Campylobacterales bacterium]